MQNYKKKSLKFYNEQFSRDSRHAETLKARESSRFKRLSFLRSISGSIEESTESMEVLSNKDTSSNNIKPSEQTKSIQKPSQKCQPTRREMLYKWREEKLLKKELEMKSKKKPFYAGSNTNQQLLKNPSALKNSLCMKSSFINQSKSRLNISKNLNSKILAPSTSIQSSKIPNVSKPAASSFKAMNSGLRMPSIKISTATLIKPSTANEISSAKVKNQVNVAASTSKIVNSKGSVKTTPTTGIFFSKKNNISSTKVNNQVNEVSSASKTVNSGLRVPTVKIIPPTRIKLPKINENCATKVKNQVNMGSTSSKSASSGLPIKPISKVDATVTKPVSGIPTKYSKGIPVSKPSNQIPASSIGSKKNITKPLNKPVPKEALKSSENVTTLKGVKAKEPVPNSEPEQSARKEISCSETDLLSVQKLNIPDTTISCDDISFVSSSTSFAPVDYKFQPPAGLDIFMFDDDPFEAIENVKRKFMCRTSTPTKAAVETPPNLSSKEMVTIKPSSPEKPPLCLPRTPDFQRIKQIIEDQMKSMKLEDGKQDKDDIPDDGELSKHVDKSIDAKPKRISVLKGVCVLNAIHETSEVEGVLNSPIKNASENSQNFVFTPRRSARLHSALQQSETPNDNQKSPVKEEAACALNEIHETSEAEGVLNSPIKNASENSQHFMFTPRRSARLHSILRQSETSNDNKQSPFKKEAGLVSPSVTPRRSLRLQKTACTKVHLDDSDILSPFKGKKSTFCNFTVRPSTKLIDLNFDISDFDDDAVCSPAGGRCQKTNITSDFEKMKLNSDENMDPNKVLIDFKNIPEPERKIKSKKISLLYSPEKRASVRMSIRGDLMSFSPSSS